MSQINFYNTVSAFCWGDCYLTKVLFASSERYFDMKKNQCKEGLDIYKKFLARMTKLSEFLKVAEVNKLHLWKGYNSAVCTGTVVYIHNNFRNRLMFA